jgi:ribosomal protein L11 methyltransferase
VSDSAFRFKLQVPKRVNGEDREDFFSSLWDQYAQRGLLGIHEGTLLSEEAAEQGLETESWTVDAAEAPRERDWVQDQELAEAELYFASREQAEEARAEIERECALRCGQVIEQKPEDWNASWKASFNALEKGFEIPPFWKIYPSWIEKGREEDGRKIIRINPGAGFGTGTHETTQLCLQAIGDVAKAHGGRPGHADVQSSKAGAPLLENIRALDFGSGSGILAIGAALLGAQVSAVEIDSLAIENALENAALNGVDSLIVYTKTLGPVGDHFPLVIANILRPVLIEFAPELVRRMAPRGALILSGLIEKDVAEVDQVFSGLLGRKPELRSLNEWRCLVWR